MVIMSVLYGLMAIQLSHSNLGLRAQSKSKHGKGKSSSCSISKTRSSGNCRRGIVRMLGKSLRNYICSIILDYEVIRQLL